ncbi:putative septum site-determining protein MinC [Xylanibacillus composti]|uniref:Probable septum site-determining protein MinC n=1 Tax=Xylanibacillus composti TaxID=1572762 RepID=A0A8J4H7V8_9BACL|nr:septum site-determining protein MinC [Xylanibacillus composti]GIQ70173.1 putative septum site-determining protein MinC [Xylanibacillus composti]
MAAEKHHVTIKGNKEGLIFLLDDSCSFETLLQELRYKLEKTHQKILTGPIIHVFVKLGRRKISESDKEALLTTIKSRGNLIVQRIENEEDEEAANKHDRLLVHKGIVRSGQTFTCSGSVLFIGDINPGGSIIAKGDIFIMGSLRGLAHAGSEGDESAVIAASHMRPTQLRIAGVISRPPDEWGFDETHMDFAYLNEGKMEINKLNQLHKIRPDIREYKGV